MDEEYNKDFDVDEEEIKEDESFALKKDNMIIKLGKIEVMSISECSGIFIGENYCYGWRSQSKSNTGLKVHGEGNTFDRPTAHIRNEKF